MGEAAGSETAFTSVLSISPRIEAECFLLEKTKIKAVAEKSKAHFCFPSAALCSAGPRGEDVAGGLGSAGAFQRPHRPAKAIRKTLHSARHLFRGQRWDRGLPWEMGQGGQEPSPSRPGCHCLGTPKNHLDVPREIYSVLLTRNNYSSQLIPFWQNGVQNPVSLLCPFLMVSR